MFWKAIDIINVLIFTTIEQGSFKIAKINKPKSMNNKIFGPWIIKKWSPRLFTHTPDISPFEIETQEIIEETSIELWQDEKFTSGIYEHGLMKSVKREADFDNYCFEFSTDKFYTDSDYYVLNIWDIANQRLLKKASWEFDVTNGISLSLWDYPIFSKLMELQTDKMLLREVHEIEEVQTYVHDITLVKLEEFPIIKATSKPELKEEKKEEKEEMIKDKAKRSFWQKLFNK